MVNKSRGLKQVIQSVVELFAEPSIEHRAIAATQNYRKAANVETLPTGLRPVDRALGIGGLPYSSITELVGPGVTPMTGGVNCVAATIAAKTQRQQKIVTIIDMNHSFDPWQAERCGLVAPQLLLSRPGTIFEALTTLENGAHHAQLVIVVMGIVSELLNQIEPELLKTLLRRLQNIVRHANSAFLFITHPPQNDPFNPKNYPTGFPLAQIADVRLWVQDEDWSYKSGLSTAYKANLTVIKSRFSMAGKGANIKIKLTSG